MYNYSIKYNIMTKCNEKRKRKETVTAISHEIEHSLKDKKHCTLYYFFYSFSVRSPKPIKQH